ncbi:ATP-binding protein [Companilactobacillus zhachilii]|uniref:ATP-binding protein n=1 Tax=Companilactobacillus zhachilii TaxID=2304606 RepID=UPI004033A210
MKLVKVKIHNFRGYTDAIIDMDDQMTTLIGKNDVGKSTIVDALEIFFNSSIVKLDAGDLNIHVNNDNYIAITCEFSDIPSSIVIDSTQETSLSNEYLLNAAGNLELKKVYDCSKKSIKPQIYAVTKYPKNTELEDLLYLTNSKLKSILKKKPNEIQESVSSLTTNAPIRAAIRNSVEIKDFITKEIDLQKVDGKQLWTKIESELPIFALFQSDRPSNDTDSEVQDPMNSAVKEAISKASDQLLEIQRQVKDEVNLVAKKTIEKLREMDPEIAKGLKPQYQDDPHWNRLFKFAIEDEQGIPLNKRGSGVRRLVLLNFFRAKIDLSDENSLSNGLIYAVEEPETAQHPDNQRKIMNALLELGLRDNCQVIITTHLSETAKLAPKTGIRLITRSNNITHVSSDENAVDGAAKEVGFYPNYSNTKLVLYVEGPTDIDFFLSVSRLLNKFNGKKYLDFNEASELLIVPMGGGTLEQWVTNKYLGGLGLPSFYLFDQDTDNAHQKEVDKLSEDALCILAKVTDKREIENYISPSTIRRYFDNMTSGEIKIPEINGMTDVPTCVKDAGLRKRQGQVKKLLDSEVASSMTAEEFFENDDTQFMSKFIEKISEEILSLK